MANTTFSDQLDPRAQSKLSVKNATTGTITEVTTLGGAP